MIQRLTEKNKKQKTQPSITNGREEATSNHVGRVKTVWEANGLWLSTVGREPAVQKEGKKQTFT